MAEREFSPDWAVAPAAVLTEWMELHQLTRRRLQECAPLLRRVAQMTGLEDGFDPVGMIEDVLDRRELSSDCAVLLHGMTGISADFWLRFEKIYRDGLAAGLKEFG